MESIKLKNTIIKIPISMVAAVNVFGSLVRWFSSLKFLTCLSSLSKISLRFESLFKLDIWSSAYPLALLNSSPIISLLFSVGLSQVTLTEEEAVNISNNIKELQIQVDSLSTIDSLKTVEVDLLNQKISLLEEQVKLSEKKTELVKPSWYENKWLYFTYGAGLSFGVTSLVYQIIK